jgi:tRNA A-37 threonylcarbamoyl transferase component Bud32
MSPSGAPFRRSYAMHGAIAAGGMATVHVGRLLGPSGFTRRVAIKRLHPQLAENEEIASMFAAEARMSARVVHANVVPVLDVVSADKELLLVMEYVHGESLSRLLSHARKAGKPVPVAVVVTVLAEVLHGLHAAHEATGEDGAPLRLVHRDVSPQNVLVGADGVTRVVDFGIAKALGQGTITRDGPLRGKIPYMAPEQLLRRSIDRRVDVYAVGVVLWEALAGRRLFEGDDEPTLFGKVLEDPVPPPSRFNEAVGPELDDITLRAMDRDPDRRFPDARAMALALEEHVARAPSSAVADWVKTGAAAALAERQAKIDAMERDTRGETVDPLATAIRAPFASVFLQDAAAPPRRTAKRKPLVLVGIAGLLVVGGVTTFALWPRSTAPPASIAPPGSAMDVAVASSTPTDIAASTTPPSPTAAASGTPGKAPSSAAKGGSGVRLCKVLDPDKQIFVMRPMRVSRCP